MPSTLWVAYWEWDGTFGFSGDTFNVEVEQHGQSHIWNIQLPVLRKQIHSASLIFSLCHGSDPQWQSLHSSQKRFPRPQQLLTASQHQSLSQLHSSSHGMTCHTGSLCGGWLTLWWLTAGATRLPSGLGGLSSNNLLLLLAWGTRAKCGICIFKSA